MGKLSCDLCRLLFGGGQSDCDEVGLHAAPAITPIHGCDFEAARLPCAFDAGAPSTKTRCLPCSGRRPRRRACCPGLCQLSPPGPRRREVLVSCRSSHHRAPFRSTSCKRRGRRRSRNRSVARRQTRPPSLWSARRAAQLAHHKPKKGRGKKRKVTRLPDDLPSMVDDEAGFRAACGLLAAGLEADAPPSKTGGVLGFLARKKRRSDPVPLPSAERRSARPRTPKVIYDAPDSRCPAKGGPGCCPARANNARPSAEERKLREELELLKRENAKLKKPSLCAEDASLLDALL